MRTTGMALGLMLALAMPAWAQGTDSFDAEKGPNALPPNRTAERDLIHQERQALAATRKLDEAACYRRFAVEDCLQKIRAHHRDAEQRLRARELQLNDASRKVKAAERLRSIENKQQAEPDRLNSPGPVRVDVRQAPANAADLRAQHDQQAQDRAAQQRIRQQAGAESRAQRAHENAERAAAARERSAENLRSAQERRERLQKLQMEEKAKGRQPAAPLPAAPAFAPAKP